jgi:hypothetical protein
MNTVPQVHPDLKRHVVDGLAAFLNGDMLLAAREFRQAAIACEDVGVTVPKHLVPPPGSLANGYMELAERATDAGAKRHWRELAEAEMGAAR